MNFAAARRHAICTLVLVGATIALRLAIVFDEWVMWRGRLAPQAAAALGYDSDARVRVTALEGNYEDVIVVTVGRPVVTACDATCVDAYASSCAVVVSKDACAAHAGCDRSCGFCGDGCAANETTWRGYVNERSKRRVDVTCREPTKLSGGDCRRLRAARAFATAAFACALACTLATGATAAALALEAPVALRVLADFVAALSGNLGSAAALGALFCASANGAKRASKGDDEWARQHSTLRRSALILFAHVFLESLIAAFSSRSAYVAYRYRRLASSADDGDDGGLELASPTEGAVVV